MEDSTPGESASAPEDPLLPEDLRDQLLSLVADRLSAGETLVSEAHFQKVLEEGYQALVGTPVSVQIREALGRVVAETIVASPEVFVVPGLENWITKAFLGSVRARKWGVLEMQERGNAAIREFIRQDAVKNLLAQLDINPAQLNTRRCLSRVSNQVAGREDPQQQAAAVRLTQVMSAARTRAATAPVEGRKTYMLEPAAEPTPEEAEAREVEQKQVQAALRKEQLGKLMAHLDAYVEQGRLSPEDAERLRQLNKVDEAVKTGRVDRDKGSRIRNSILSGEVRDKLEKKVKDTVDYVVLYLQVFRGLQRIEPRYDPSLRYLIQHKAAVNADEIDPEDLAAAVQELIEDVDTLHLLIALMDRQDAEVRMMAARLPPYSYIVRRTQDRVENLVIEESFVDDLRQLSEDEVSGRLQAPDKRIQVRAAADMLCVNALVSRLIKPTPFRKELRLLKINLILEEFYRTADNIEEARAKAEEFLRTRLRSLYPDLTAEESAELDRRGAEMLDAVEQKAIAAREEAQRAAAAEGSGPAETDDPEADLSEEEVEKGVQFGRVAVRVAGTQRLIPYKIMPDPEHPSSFVLAQKDADTGELVPVVRQGVKRYVARSRDGTWALTKPPQ